MRFLVWLHSELVLGQRRLRSSFSSSVARTLKAGGTMGTATGSNGGIHHLRAGWVCQFSALAYGCRAIVYVYLPGDVIGLDTLLRTRPLENVLTLTSVTVETIPVRDVLTELMADRPTALFVAWLLGERQRRTDRLLAGISGLDARGRVAMMVLDFLHTTAPPKIDYRVDLQPSVDAGANRRLPRLDGGACQPGLALIARRADRQPGEALRDDPRSRPTHQPGSKRPNGEFEYRGKRSPSSRSGRLGCRAGEKSIGRTQFH